MVVARMGIQPRRGGTLRFDLGVMMGYWKLRTCRKL